MKLWSLFVYVIKNHAQSWYLKCVTQLPILIVALHSILLEDREIIWKGSN